MQFDTVARIRSYIIDSFLFGDASAMLTDDDSLLSKGVIDSTGVLDLMTFMEDEFGIQVADEDVTPDNFDSVTSLARYAELKRIAGAPEPFVSINSHSTGQQQCSDTWEA
jgi:acyl carrier protein